MSDSREPLRDDQIAKVFSNLANEYVDSRRPERRQVWKRLESHPVVVWPKVRRGGVARWWQLAVAPLAAAAAVMAFVALSGGEPLTYELEGARLEDGMIQADASPARLVFSDASRVELGAHTALSVSIAGEKSALARLAQGRLDVAVQHEEGTDWRFFAGPYEVHVEGTTFAVEWRPEREWFRLAMTEGRVRVSGPGGMSRVLVGGEVMEVAAPTVKPESVASAPSLDAKAASVPEAKPASATGAGRGVAASAAARSWTKLVGAGQFAEVVRLAASEGVDTVLAQRGAGDLQALAQAARYSGDVGLAQRSWKSVRQRFSGSGASAQAAYFLGRVHEQQGNSSEAIRWLGTYLNEAPGGVYAAEALGQKLVLVQRTQGRSAARGPAREYVRSFPKGSYAETARGILRAE